MTKFNIFTIASFILIFTASCTIQKRTHRSGYYIDWHKKSTNVVAERAVAKNDFVATADNEIILPKKEEHNFSSQALVDCGDTLYLLNGDKIICKVIEINEESINYKQCDNIDGPIYSTSSSGVSKIVYINGTSEAINSNNVITKKSNQTNACNDTLYFKDGKIVYCEIIEVQKEYVKYRKCDSLNKAEYYAEKRKLKKFDKPITKPITKAKSADNNSSRNTKNDTSTNPVKKYHPLAIASFLFGLFAQVALALFIIYWSTLAIIIGLSMLGIALVIGIIAIIAINKEKNKFKGIVFAFLGTFSILFVLFLPLAFALLFLLL